MSLRSGVLAVLGLACVLFLAPKPASAQSVTLISKMGAKCLNAEGGTAKGARLIRWGCNTDGNERFQFYPDGTIRQNGLCVDVKGGLGRDGDQIELWDCNGQPNQKWRLADGQLVGMGNKCIDLQGGSFHFFGNQPAILWPCNGQDNQHWYRGVVVPATRVRVASNQVVSSGDKKTLAPVSASAGVIAAGGGNVISAGGGNVISAGGGNVISAGGGNLIVVTQ